jgi:hypothetical protein
MDPDRFDELVLALGTSPSRRSLLRGFGKGTLIAVLTALSLPQGAAACKNDGAKCKKSSDCCSGACKGKKRKKRACRAAPEARGCTIDDPYATPCPDRTRNTQYCWITLGGKPFCGTSVQCLNCSSNDECAEEFGNPSARCVTVDPGVCLPQYNNRSCVVFP